MGLWEALPETQHPSHGKCYRLCKENHLLVHKKRPYSLTKTGSHASQDDALVRRDFTASAPRRKYISDMIETKCSDGKLYLASILDCFDGAVIGYAMCTYMHVSLCDARCSFPAMAIKRFDPVFESWQSIYLSGIP